MLSTLPIDETEKWNTEKIIEYLSEQNLNLTENDFEFFRKQRIEGPIPDVFAKIIQYTANTPSLRSTGTIIIRNILRNYMKTIIRNLSSDRYPLCQSTLRLLIMMNSHDITTTRELQESFPYGIKALGKLLNIRKNEPKDQTSHAKNDIRTLYIRFILTFLTHGDSKVKSCVLETKNFANAIFKGLSCDPYELVDEVLKKFHDFVIADNQISRKTKASFFNTGVLNHLLRLYSRNEFEPPESNKTVASVVHKFLLSICCVPGVGICFRDAGWYSCSSQSSFTDGIDKTKDSGKVKLHNIILSSFIKSLKPTQDLKQQELLLKILEVCPELVQIFWQYTNISFEPYLSYKWIANMTLFHKIIALPVPSLYVPDTNVYPEVPPEVTLVMDNILPRMFDRSALNKCLNHQSQLVKYKTIITLCVMFQKLGKVKQAFDEAARCLDVLSNESSNEKKSSNRWLQTTDSIFEEIKRRVPDIQVLLRIYHQTLTCEQKLSADLISDEVTEEYTRNSMMHEMVLRLIKYYHQFLPEAVMESKFDIGKFIPANLEEIQPTMQLHILELLLLVSDFNLANKPENNRLTILLMLYSHTPYPQIYSIIRRVIIHLLSKSLPFQHDPNEAIIWLECLPRIVSVNKTGQELFESDSVLKFLDESISIFFKDPFPYIDELSQIINDTDSDVQQTDLMEIDELRIAQDISIVLAEKLGNIYYNIKNIPFSYPFSPLLAVVMKQCQNMKPITVGVISFLHRLFKNLLNKQITPSYLYVYVKQLNKIIESSLENLDQKNHWDVKDYIGNLNIYFQQYSNSHNFKWHNNKDKYQKIIEDSNLSNLDLARIKFLDLVSSIPPPILNYLTDIELSQLLDCILSINIFDTLYSLDETVIRRYMTFLSLLSKNIMKLGSRTHITDHCFKKLLYLWQKQPTFELDTVILQLIEAYMPPGLIDNENVKYFQFTGTPNYLLLIKNINSSVVRFIFDNLNILKAKILSCLIICNSEIRLEFVNLILLNPQLLESVSLKDFIVIASAFIDIVSSKTHLQINWSPIVTENDKNAIKTISDKCGLRFFRSITTSYKEKSPSIYANVVCALISLSPPVDLIEVLKFSIKNGSFDLFSLDYLSIIECHLAGNITDCDEQELKIFISGGLHQATLFMEKENFKNCSNEVLKAIFNKIDDLIKFVPKSTSLDANIIGEFIFVLLEKKIDEPTILKCITSLMISAYNKETIFGPSLDKVVEAIINNPQFKVLCEVPVLSRKDDKSQTSLNRLAISNLLNTVFRINSETCCKPSYLNIFLSRYGASTSLADQLLLDIFILYEKSSNTSIVSSAMMWGTGSARQIDRRSLMGQRILVESLDLIDPMIMMRSYTHFPIDKELEVHLNPIEIESYLRNDLNEDSVKWEQDLPVYDPSYFLPLFANLLSYGNLLDVRKFIEINALGFIVVSLSSTVENVRRAGYYLMDEFYGLLEHATFRERSQILLLLNSFKNSIVDRDNENKSLQRIPTIISVFIAHALNVFTNPAHFMYPIINKFLLQRPILDLEDVPMFYNLFHTSSKNYQKERVWILRLLSAGLKTHEDYKIFKRRYVWDVISSFYNSPLADNISRKLIIEILFRSASIPQTITDMVKNRGLLTWLQNLCFALPHSPSVNESVFFGIRILLRVLQGCKNSTLQWSNGALIDQTVIIVSNVLKSFDLYIVKEETISWTLNYLNAIIRTFHYLMLISSTPNRVFTPHHISYILPILEKCEIHLKSKLITDETPKLTINIIHNLYPSLTDNLEGLYLFDSNLIGVYKQIIRMLFEMVISGGEYDIEVVNKIVYRALSMGVSTEAKIWTVACMAECKQ
ncbi:ribosome 60S biogenesis N-terminal-domain-containing protein [Gigaspora rosea]|uniref:Ribosome 60S biogenesis N-terminal-domain-containing protein n=1 Tax=Gigaspora rosea TaxID=44941 RepID=A0A397VB65_9GLOM|nr:ribosome 60S biogenesis N-terminal-domain-containing protein [Gigaspora rosea]